MPTSSRPDYGQKLWSTLVWLERVPRLSTHHRPPLNTTRWRYKPLSIAGSHQIPPSITHAATHLKHWESLGKRWMTINIVWRVHVQHIISMQNGRAWLTSVSSGRGVIIHAEAAIISRQWIWRAQWPTRLYSRT